MRATDANNRLSANSGSETAPDLKAVQSKRRKGLRFALALFLALLIPFLGGLAIAGGWAWYHFGSRTAALAFLRGHTFLLASQPFDLGIVRQKEKRALTIRAVNLSGRPIMIYCVQGYCGHRDGCV